MSTTLAPEVRLDTSEPDVIIRTMITINRAIDDYLDDLIRRGYSDRTRATYSRLLDKFCDRFPDQTDVSEISLDDCRRFLALWQRKARGTQAHVEAVLASFMRWLYKDGKIARNPMDRMERTRRIPPADLEVLSVSTDDVRKLLAVALASDSWTVKLTIWILCLMGPRRRAVALLRVRDYDRDRRRLRFQEKGGKTIWKPVPDELVPIIEGAIASGLYSSDQDYLIPSEGPRSRSGERDDRVIWRIVKDVAEQAGVHTHVHALRAAFACYYLEQNRGDVKGLQDLLGHRSIQTTSVYLRKLDKEQSMETVRTLSWGVAQKVNA